MSDTPRTDAELRANGAHVETAPQSTSPFVDYDFARTLERELSAARAELATAREHEAAALSGQRQLLAKYDGALRQLEEARVCLGHAMNRIEHDEGVGADYTTEFKRWRKAAGMDATAGEVKA